MGDEPDYTTVLHRPDEQGVAARLRYVPSHDAYEPVRMSAPMAMAEAQALAQAWATETGLEYRP